MLRYSLAGIFLLASTSMFWLVGCKENSARIQVPEATVTPENPTSTKGSISPLNFVEKSHFLATPFEYHNGEDSEYFGIIEALGGGVASLDFDRDGLWDLVIPGGGDLLPENQIKGRSTGFYRNIGNWNTIDLTHLFPSASVFTHGAFAADFDNDGFCDVLLTGYGAVQFVRNMGDGFFRDFTSDSQLLDDSWSTAAAWGDLNGDGDLDLYIAHYANWSFDNNPVCLERPSNLRDTCAPRNFQSLDDSVYLSTGDGRFVRADAELGFIPGGKGLGVLTVDLDGDGDLDVYVANDGEPNFIYQNDGGKFADISVISGADRNERGLPDGSMGLEVSDYNGDQLPDIWVTNFEKESMALYRGMPGNFYQHVSQPLGITGIGTEYVGWGVCLRDFDGDGDDDAFVAAGHANRHSPTSPRFQHPILLENQHSRIFKNVASSAGEFFRSGHLGRGVSATDFDNDGRVDLAVSRILAPTSFLENTSNVHQRNWIGLELIGRKSSRDPVGSRVTLQSKSGRQTRFVVGGASYLSSSDTRIVFHSPDPQAETSLEITWPSGQVQQVSRFLWNRYQTIVEADVTP